VHEGSKRAIVAALLANLGIAISKFVAFLITGSASLFAESLHSVADTGNQALLLLGGSRARRAADAQHEFGYGRERYFWSFVVALVLFSLGGLFALYEGAQKLGDPHELESAGVAVGVLLFAIVLESFSLRTAVREANHVRAGLGWARFIRRSKNPELPVVLLEDVGALVGLTFALAGVSLAIITGDERWDAVGSLAIGALLVAIAAVLAVEMKSFLIGESADPQRAAAIRTALEGGDEVVRVIHMRTEHLGPEELLVAAKVEFVSGLSVERLAAAVDEAERCAREAVPERCVIYLEPDLYRAPAPR